MSSTIAVSPGSLNVNPAFVNPKTNTVQASATHQANLDAGKIAKSTKTDTVTISAQALNKLSNGGGSMSQETKGGGAGNVKSFSAFA